MGELLKDLVSQKECKIEEGHLMSDHVPILILIPPKHSVAQVVGFMKGKSGIARMRGRIGGEESNLLVRASAPKGMKAGGY